MLTVFLWPLSTKVSTRGLQSNTTTLSHESPTPGPARCNNLETDSVTGATRGDTGCGGRQQCPWRWLLIRAIYRVHGPSPVLCFGGVTMGWGRLLPKQASGLCGRMSSCSLHMAKGEATVEAVLLLQPILLAFTSLGRTSLAAPHSPCGIFS